MYELKNPVTKYNGNHVKRFLNRVKGKWEIHPQTFAEKCGVSTSYVRMMIAKGLKIKKNLLDKIVEAYPDFIN